MPLKFVSDRDLSRLNYGKSYPTDISEKAVVPFDVDRFTQGVAARQADALESIATSSAKMAAGFSAILNRLEIAEKARDRFYKWYEEELEQKRARDRQIAALRGQITKLKKKAGSCN